ncbi:vWA domain-containing protein [Fimbriimonas ginsengisoli]|uniref:von Willebrand factor, type A n=1 Tax=Fimbriimonas ginsengisoli Gsoil 348 TaxID=661478 RepID=A0A068NNA3_FIMGI|nr:VWA domain-containing protein [Fimbriimonas ginsengisoli]AIE84936.1 von Willebrand factor, type A [Fimbriimonas ginsengisoli Gsoil 348]
MDTSRHDFPELEPLSEEMFLNSERRCPVVLLQDTSTSMAPHIHKVNEGLQVLRSDLLGDRLASQRVEIAVITFGPVQLIQDFVTVDRWLPPRLHAEGNTPLGQGLRFAIKQVKARKRAYREAGIPYYRPWIWLVTDGEPTDAWQEACDEVQAEVKSGGIEMFTIGTDNADVNVLKKIGAPRSPVWLREARYREMFVWLSQSLKPVSRGVPGTALDLPSPSAWGEIQL